ncbi:MAG: hypothetical protein V4443_05755 [Pseudomonadota bacterium]
MPELLEPIEEPEPDELVPPASEPPVVLPLDPELLPPMPVLPEPLPEDPELMPPEPLEPDDPEPELMPLEEPELPVPELPPAVPSCLLQAAMLLAKTVTISANLNFSKVFIFVSCEV